jgi:hypothetical protein
MAHKQHRRRTRCEIFADGKAIGEAHVLPNEAGLGAVSAGSDGGA